MNTGRTRLVTLTVTAALLGGLSACVIAPVPRYDGGGPVMVAPPEPTAEVIGVAPGPGYFWINGYWDWVGTRHVWVGGRWEAHRPGYAWAPHQWHREGQGWRAAPGHWERR